MPSWQTRWRARLDAQREQVGERLRRIVVQLMVMAPFGHDPQERAAGRARDGRFRVFEFDVNVLNASPVVWCDVNQHCLVIGGSPLCYRHLHRP